LIEQGDSRLTWRALDRIDARKLMDTVKKLQDLWCLRRYVVGVCVVALLAGMLVTYHMSFPPKSRSYDVGVATAQVLVDTPRSQVVGASSAVTPQGGQALGTLGTQANLLADLMVVGTIKADIAQRAGLTPNRLIGISAAVTVPSASGSALGPSSVSVPSGPKVFALTTQILTDNGGTTTLPIIEIDAYAPDRDQAVRLASAAVAGLQAFVSSKAADQRIPNADRLSIVSLGVSQATSQTRGSSPLMGIVVALGVLLLGCVSILWILAMVRGWRSASERERLGFGEPLEANGVSQRHVPTNGVAGTSNHGAPASAADYPSLPTADTSGQDLASSLRQSSSRRWSTTGPRAGSTGEASSSSDLTPPLGEFDRHGLLAISQRENTMIVGLVPDADERIAQIEANRRSNT
jgi:hypothetical protein